MCNSSDSGSPIASSCNCDDTTFSCIHNSITGCSMTQCAEQLAAMGDMQWQWIPESIGDLSEHCGPLCDLCLARELWQRQTWMQPQHGTCKATLSPLKQCTCQAYAAAYGQQVSLVAAGCLFDQDSRIHLAHDYASLDFTLHTVMPEGTIQTICKQAHRQTDRH